MVAVFSIVLFVTALLMFTFGWGLTVTGFYQLWVQGIPGHPTRNTYDTDTHREKVAWYEQMLMGMALNLAGTLCGVVGWWVMP